MLMLSSQSGLSLEIENFFLFSIRTETPIQAYVHFVTPTPCGVSRVAFYSPQHAMVSTPIPCFAQSIPGSVGPSGSNVNTSQLGFSQLSPAAFPGALPSNVSTCAGGYTPEALASSSSMSSSSTAVPHVAIVSPSTPHNQISPSVSGVSPVQEEPRQVEHVVSASGFNPAMNDSKNVHRVGDSSAGDSFVPQDHNLPSVSVTPPVQEESRQIEHVVSDSGFNPAMNDKVTCANDGGTMLTSSSFQTVSTFDNQVVTAASTIPEVGGNRHRSLSASSCSEILAG
ncbi:hypothetical protein V6N11_070087 [Hibiscus sabdariffa]|uniref:Uncharacterized protein n=1 Tax=Hibiscus sabdariffa TaxID=183260 RepID=A0ABR2QE03_9ROSI